MDNVPNIAPQRENYDAIVVGSGITGGWAAKELTEKGLNTLVLERGRHVEHGAGYVTEHKPTWEMEFRGQGNRREFAEEYPRQSMAPGFEAATKHFFVKDNKHPYEFDDDEPFLWVRGYHLGGRSLTWGRACYRWGPQDFKANAREGITIDWPIRYEDLKPWYDYVENYVGISGRKEGLRQVPDGPFLPPLEMNVAEKRVKKGIDDAYADRTMTNGRLAVLTKSKPEQNRAACHYCGPCTRGCSAGAYFSSLSSTLPAAQATGNLTLNCDSIVHSVKYDHEKGRATGVRVIDRKTKEAREHDGKVVFLCASAFGSIKILLNSMSSRFPKGLANSSGTLGRYIMDHHFKVGASGTVPNLEDRYYFGHSPGYTLIPRFRNLGEKPDPGVDFLRGYQYTAGATREDWSRGTNQAGVGADFKRRLRHPGKWRTSMLGFGEFLPREDNYVELDDDQTDEWGIPVLRAHVSLGENEKRMREDMKKQAAEMLEAAGCKDVEPYESRYWPGEAIHEMGGARMGRNPDTSVLNKWNQSHDIPNLFVTDGSCMVSSATQNPSVTYMAITARACDYAVKEMKRNNI